MKLKMTACIEAPKEKVWQILSNVLNVDLWVDPILSAHYEGDKKNGVGTTRVCNLKGNMKVKEEWIDWVEGTSYTYQASGVPLMKSAKNKWSVKSVNEKTLLTTESDVEVKGGIFGKALEPLILLWSKRTGSDSLASIKHLIETGQAYKGKFSKLPRAPISC